MNLSSRDDRFEPQDIQLDTCAQGIVASAYEFFRSYALDEAPEGDSQTASALKSWLESSVLFLSLAGDLDRELIAGCETFMKTDREREGLSNTVQKLRDENEDLRRQLEESRTESTILGNKLAVAGARLQTLSEHAAVRETSFREEVASLKQNLSIVNRELCEIFDSPGWKVIQWYRHWVEKQRQAHPRIFRRYESVALWILRRTEGNRQALGETKVAGDNPHARHDQLSEAATVRHLLSEDHTRREIAKFLLIVSGYSGDAYRYRADHQSEELRLLGLTVDVTSFDSVDYDVILGRYSVFILHRVLHTEAVERFIKRAKMVGKPVIFDVDDLVFYENFIGDIEAIRNCPPQDYKLHLDGIRRSFRTLSLCHAALVSTEPLQDRIKELFPRTPVYVNRNAVSDEMVRQADFALEHVPKIDDGSIRIIYMSGTMTHNKDFAQCIPALEKLLQAYPQVRLMIVGLLTLPDRLNRWADRLEIIPLLRWQDLPKLMRRADINLAPLEPENAFANCKSELKYFEAGLLELPTVASQVPAFQTAIVPGENGFLCISEQDWFDSMERLVLSPELRSLIGSRARRHVLDRYTTRNRASELARALGGIFEDLRIVGPSRLSIAILIQASSTIQIGERDEIIFSIANGLADRGHDVHVYAEAIAQLAGLTDAEIVALYQRYFAGSTAQIHVGHDRILPSDIALATDRPTAFTINNLTNSKCKVFLIQDFEWEFFDSSEPAQERAKSAYDLPLKKITIGECLQTFFSRRDRVPIAQISLSLDSSIFRNLKVRPELPIRVLFFAQPNLRLDTYSIGVEALRILADACPEVEIAFYGVSVREDLGFEYQNLGDLSPEQLALEMNRSYIHLSLSIGNISWLPFKAMACGCVVVEAKVPAIEMLMQETTEISVLVEPTPHAAADALIKLIRDPGMRQRISANGERYVLALTVPWEGAVEQIERILLEAIFADEQAAPDSLTMSHAGVVHQNEEARNIRASFSIGRALSDEERAPVVIGAMGGSGTRVVARIMRDAGFFIGGRLNEPEDSLDVADFLDRWIGRYLRRELDPLTESEAKLMRADFEDFLTLHRGKMATSSMAWGWKEPRSIYLLPFFYECFPQMKFIHLLRDGRDMAFSNNQNQLNKYGDAFLGPEFFHDPQPVRTAALWRNVNITAASFGEVHLGAHYLRLKFEDLCAQPAIVVERVFSFLGASETDIRLAIEEISPPESIGRWKALGDHHLQERIFEAAQLALEKFGYIVSPS